MSFVNSYITVAVCLVVIGIVIIAILRWHGSDTPESRLKRMMLSCGIDEMTALYADNLLKLDMNAVRSRCRHCLDTDLCDRWLDGEAVAGNSFCPNVWHFTAAARSRQQQRQGGETDV
jgi:hypothetical protein